MPENWNQSSSSVLSKLSCSSVWPPVGVKGSSDSRCSRGVSLGALICFEAVAVAPLHAANVVVLQADECRVEEWLHQLRLVDRANVYQACTVAMLMGEDVVEIRGQRQPSEVVGVDFHVAVGRVEVVCERVRSAGAVDVAATDADVALNVLAMPGVLGKRPHVAAGAASSGVPFASSGTAGV